MEYTFSCWEEYWKLFDILLELLDNNNQKDIAKSFKESQQLVNGLTDGWYEFKFSFEKILESNKGNLNDEQLEIAEALLKGINKSLRR